MEEKIKKISYNILKCFPENQDIYDEIYSFVKKSYKKEPIYKFAHFYVIKNKGQIKNLKFESEEVSSKDLEIGFPYVDIIGTIFQKKIISTKEKNKFQILCYDSNQFFLANIYEQDYNNLKLDNTYSFENFFNFTKNNERGLIEQNPNSKIMESGQKFSLDTLIQFCSLDEGLKSGNEFNIKNVYVEGFRTVKTKKGIEVKIYNFWKDNKFFEIPDWDNKFILNEGKGVDIYFLNTIKNQERGTQIAFSKNSRVFLSNQEVEKPKKQVKLSITNMLADSSTGKKYISSGIVTLIYSIKNIKICVKCLKRNCVHTAPKKDSFLINLSVDDGSGNISGYMTGEVFFKWIKFPLAEQEIYSSPDNEEILRELLEEKLLLKMIKFENILLPSNTPEIPPKAYFLNVEDFIVTDRYLEILENNMDSI